MKRALLMVAALALLFSGVGQAKADFSVNFVYLDNYGDAASGILTGTANGPGDSLFVTGGSINVTGSYLSSLPTGAYPLLAAGPGVTTSPSGAWIVDNLLYPNKDGGSGVQNGGAVNPTYLDFYGLLFGNAGAEINVFATIGAGSDYTFGIYNPANGTNTGKDLSGGMFLISSVPEPSGIALLGLGVVCLAAGYVVRRRKLVLA